MIPLTAYTLTLPCLWAGYRVVRLYPDMNIAQVIIKVFGKVPGFFVVMFWFLLTLWSFVLDLRGFAELLSVLYYPIMPLALIVLLLLLSAAINASRGLEALGSTCYISLPFLVFGFLVLLILMIRSSELNRIFPLLGNGVVEIAKETVLRTSTFSHLLLLMLFLPALRDKKRFMLATGWSSAIIAVMSAAVYGCYVAFFDFPLFITLSTPIHETATYVSIGEYFTHIEIFFLFLQLIAVGLKFTFYLYVIALLFGMFTRIRPFESTAVPMAAAVFVLTLLPDNAVIYSLYLREWYFRISSIGLLLLPLVLWAVHRMRRRRLS
jgi:spore germination protein (amino acid permease)